MKNIKLTAPEANEIEMVIGRLLDAARLDNKTVIGARAEAAIALIRGKLAA